MLSATGLARARARLRRHGQEHVLRFFEELDDDGRARLLAQIEELDLDWLDRVLAAEPPRVDPADLTPCTEVILPGGADDAAARRAGEEALRRGRVGVLVVAGGQGTRLGFEGPKGLFPIGPVSGSTLFQIHAERIVSTGRRYGVTPPLYLLTGDSGHKEACEYFKKNNYFGIPRDRVQILQQGLAPAVDFAGKLLLDAKDRLVLSPSGNGGLFLALRRHGAFDHMAALGVDALSYIQVDNPLSASTDPLFIGHHLLAQSEYSCKAIRKTAPLERVGHYALVRGRLRVVEYTEIPEALVHETTPQGTLRYLWANPGLFIWDVAFALAQSRRLDLPFHRAHKKIPYLDEQGELVSPEEPCGVKLESFAMDTLEAAHPALLLACERDAEFAPVKNAEGADSPDSARRLMQGLHRAWLRLAGIAVRDKPPVRVEISPLFALDAEEVRARWKGVRSIEQDLYLREP
jgi:UDP-N-acetylglucosamine/UDP-N-acetylgalactosamine diphosphorylase